MGFDWDKIMKDKMIVIVMITLIYLTACGPKKTNKYLLDDNASAKELLDQYMQGVFEPNSEKLVAVMPDFMQDSYEEIYTQEYLDEYKQYLETTYGSDVKGFVVIEEEIEVLDETINGINGYLLEYSGHIKPSKCYMIHGSFHLEGSTTSEDLPFGDNIARCNFDGKWRIIIA